MNVPARPVDLEAREIAMPTGVLTVRADRGGYGLDELVGFAARANAKRGFLFVSKVLGKHWPARPAAMAGLHASLAAGIPDLPGPVVFIAMAETAVGLGHGVFDAWRRTHGENEDQGKDESKDEEEGGGGGPAALFMHTTRYRIAGVPLIEFEETHSHAPRQFLHMPADAALRALFLRARSLVLIDDEASTGNTFVNLAHACRALNPGLRHVHVAMLTNFMGEAANARLRERFGLAVSHSAALYGEYGFAPGPAPAEAAPAQRASGVTLPAGGGAVGGFGRGALARPLGVPPQLVEALAAGIAPGDAVLVLGTGEFMHPPFLLARALEARGCDVVLQSTTRSPILEWGAIGCRLNFPDNYGEGIANYLYNVRPGQYRHVLICHETPPGPALLELAATLNGRLLHFLSEVKVEEIPVR